ncbi:MAG: vWA domain-containing protein [Ornithinimicrobium sp.]|uniref:vWA domain-containing protein n=1 Tax=Ornithinimicrobium sp. TaxID=1977084 RepID=UPI003D9AC4FE
MTWTIEASLLGFAGALRAAGLPVTADRERTFLRGVAVVGLGERSSVYWTGRTTLTSSPADLEPYDRVFAQWFGGTTMKAVTGADSPRATTVQAALTDPGDGQDEKQTEASVRAQASEREVLRHRDIAGLGAGERALLRHQFATLRPRPPQRRARRHTWARRGAVDGPATLRAQLRRLGEPGPVQHRRHRVRPRRVVLLVDVSGSMSAHADALLRLAHTVVQAAPRHTEVFTIGTRLTHVTRSLRERDPDRALLAAGAQVADWSGGTRLGEGLAVFLDRWGRRGMARQAVVVVFSDGWERSGPEMLGEQMRRLRSVAHRVVWVNPHRGRPGYVPVQQGIVAALPHVDDFVAGHSLGAFADVLEVIGRA